MKTEVNKEWDTADLSGLLSAEPVGIGSSWSVPEDLVARLMLPFHETARGQMDVAVTSRTGERVELSLAGLVKFGADDGKAIQTTCLQGTAVVDARSGRLASLKLQTVSGCVRINVMLGGYVSLSDTLFSITHESEKE